VGKPGSDAESMAPKMYCEGDRRGARTAEMNHVRTENELRMDPEWLCRNPERTVDGSESRRQTRAVSQSHADGSENKSTFGPAAGGSTQSETNPFLY